MPLERQPGDAARQLKEAARAALGFGTSRRGNPSLPPCGAPDGTPSTAGAEFSGCSPTQTGRRAADAPHMSQRVIARTAPQPAPTLRTIAAALVLLAVVLAGVSGTVRVSVSAEPPIATNSH